MTPRESPSGGAVPRIDIRSVTKRFGALAALDDISLVIPEGAFVALVGPSGCGKTTLLRMSAGSETRDVGAVAFDGRLVADARTLVPPEARGVAVIFQSYALWPHMSVARNVGYAMKLRGAAKDDIDAGVEAALDRVRLQGLGGRKPEALSGGQRQRVALARALAQDASVMLCDEPLANLDAHLRAEMTATFAALHRDTGRSFIYVTHDQSEALALATTVVAMEGGRVAQEGPPHELYASPASRQVAGFIGHGALLDVAIGGRSAQGRTPVVLAGVTLTARSARSPRGPRGLLLVRPEAVGLDGTLPACAMQALYRGSHFEVVARLDDGQTLTLHAPARVAQGERLSLSIADAWLVPEEDGRAFTATE